VTPTDLTDLLKDTPIGEWLALSYDRDRIVAHHPTLAAAKQAAQLLGELNPIMMKVPPLRALIL